MNPNENLTKFMTLWGKAGIDIPCEKVLDINLLASAPASCDEDSGVAFAGGLIYHVLMMHYMAMENMKKMSMWYAIDEKSLTKICVLSQLAKYNLFIPCTEDWELRKGHRYKFADLPCVMKTGDRSHYMCSEAGIRFTIEEREAMSALDKTPEEFDKASKFLSIYSKILRWASEEAITAERAVWAKNHRK